MQKIRDCSNHNSKIVSLADNLMETLVDVEENESNQHPQDVTEITEAILEEENLANQLEKLQTLESEIRMKHVSVDKIGNKELGMLIETYQNRLKEIYPGEEDTKM